MTNTTSLLPWRRSASITGPAPAELQVQVRMGPADDRESLPQRGVDRFINDYAPEHLEILSTEPFAHLGHITEAAEILMGPHTPITIANFVLGPNAVLPTSRWARTFGPLAVTDFLKRSSIGYVTSTAYPELAAHARTLARYEGFSSHENAVSERRAAVLGGDATP